MSKDMLEVTSADNLSATELRKAALNPHQWAQALEQLAITVGCTNSYMFVLRGQTVLAGISNEKAANFLCGLIASDSTLQPGDTLQSWLKMRQSGFVDDSVTRSFEQIDLRAYRSLLNDNDMECGAIASFRLPDEQLLVLGVHRSRSCGPLQPAELIKLDQLFPCLQRELPLCYTLAQNKIASLSQGALEAFDLIGIPSAVLGPTGAMVFANDQFQTFGSTLFVDDPMRLKAHDRKADARLLSALDLVPALREEEGAYFFMPPQNASTARIALVTTLKGTQNNPFYGPHFLLTVHSLEPTGTLEPSVLATLFGLTPAESRITFSIVSGQTVDDIAANTGVSRETVRTQVKTIMNKTGMKRQVELVRNLSLAVPQFPKGRFIPE